MTLTTLKPVDAVDTKVNDGSIAVRPAGVAPV